MAVVAHAALTQRHLRALAAERIAVEASHRLRSASVNLALEARSAG